MVDIRLRRLFENMILRVVEVQAGPLRSSRIPGSYVQKQKTLYVLAGLTERERLKVAYMALLCELHRDWNVDRCVEEGLRLYESLREQDITWGMRFLKNITRVLKSV